MPFNEADENASLTGVSDIPLKTCNCKERSEVMNKKQKLLSDRKRAQGTVIVILPRFRKLRQRDTSPSG